MQSAKPETVARTMHELWGWFEKGKSLKGLSFLMQTP